jgi:hypothetical protein
MFKHILPIFLYPFNVELAEIKHDLQDTSSLLKVPRYLDTNKYNDDDEDCAFHNCNNDLINEHAFEVGLECLVKPDFSGVDHVVVGGDEVHVEHGEVVSSAVDGQFSQRGYAGDYDGVDLHLVVGHAVVEGIVEKRRVGVRNVEGLVE